MSMQEMNLKAIADAIRAKENSTDSILASDFATRIAKIQTGVTLPVLTNPASASDILSGKQAINASGQSITGTIPSLSSQTITPGTSNKIIAAGNYLSGAQIIKGDTNLVSSNIKSGVSIFGVAGSLVSGMSYYYTTEEYEKRTGTFTYTCGFSPKSFLMFNETGFKGIYDGSGVFFLFVHPESNVLFIIYKNLSTDNVYRRIYTAGYFQYACTFNSSGVTLEFSDSDCYLDGKYHIFLFK